MSKTGPKSVTIDSKRLDIRTKPAGNGNPQPLNGNTLKRRVTV